MEYARVNGYKSTLCLGIHAQRRRTKRKHATGLLQPTQDQADQIGKDLAEAPPNCHVSASA